MIGGAILDIDGVLRRGSEPVPGSVKAVERMIGYGIPIVYLSNNSTRTRVRFLSDLMAMGFPEAPVVNSAYAAAEHVLRERGMSRCLVLGEDGLIDEMRMAGHQVTVAGRGLSSYKDLPMPDHEIVVVGMDRDLSYVKIADACAEIRSGAAFIATNEDPTLPIEGGMFIPGAGSVVWSLRRCTGQVPVVIGKPEIHSTMIAIKMLGIRASDILMVGDRVDTDIEAGKRCKTQVALVLTGETSDPGEVDHAVYPDLASLVDHILM
jgi:4-nitrophenyl phosphatase